MIGFYVMRGHDHERLIQMTDIEKGVYRIWMNQYYEEEEQRMKALLGNK